MAVFTKVKLGMLSIVVFLVLYATFPKSSIDLLSEHELEYKEFQSFISTFSKSYTESEFGYRFNVYNDNVKAIRVHNTYIRDFKLAPNKFADLTLAEFSSLYKSPVPSRPLSTPEHAFDRSLLPTAIPPTQDWRDEGAVTDVIDQGRNCSSSWAIATVGAIESARVAQGLLTLQNLSVQQILDCVDVGMPHGCVGGLPDDAFNYAQTHGLTTDLIYPYTGVTQACNQAEANQTVTNITKSVDIPTGESGLLINAIAASPVIAEVEVQNYVWQFYYSGVITGFCGNNISHFVLIVGYDTTANPEYYIVKNSWGHDWGESGYVRISIYPGAGTCGIQSVPSYPIVS